MVVGGRRPSRKLSQIAGRILRVLDLTTKRHVRNKVTVSVVLSARATKRALALYTITIDRVYDSKA